MAELAQLGVADADRLLAPEEAAAIRVKVEELKQALRGTSPARITEAKENLNNSTVHLAELVVKEIIASSSGSAKSSG